MGQGLYLCAMCSFRTTGGLNSQTDRLGAIAIKKVIMIIIKLTAIANCDKLSGGVLGFFFATSSW